MAQQPMRSEEELFPTNMRFVTNKSNVRIDPDETQDEPLFEFSLEILKHHTIYNAITLTTDAPEIYMQQFFYLAKYPHAQSGTPTHGRGQGKGYMRKGDMEINIPKPKKQKDAVPRRSRTITFADNMLEDLEQALDYAKLNSTDDDKAESERDSDNGDDNDKSNNEDESVDSENDDSDKDSNDDDDQAANFEDISRCLNDPPEIQMTELLNEPLYTKSTTMTVAPLLETIQETQEDPAENVIKTPPFKTQVPKLLPKAVSNFVQPRLERTVLDVIKKNLVNLFHSTSTLTTDPTKYELRHQLYEKMFETATYLQHDKHHALYDALQESMQVDELQARFGSSKTSTKKQSHDE
ncbi:hypothetical protein Tco_1407508 [Tanacetum coccineum]